MKTYKVNIIASASKSFPVCTNCNHKFDTDYAENPYEFMCSIAMGRFTHCPKCVAKYAGCKIDGVNFEKCDSDKRQWILRGIK